MYVWTQKAEDDYREKWPDRPCKRLAGQEIEYCGSRVVSASIIDAYSQRKWVRHIEEPVVTETRGGKGRTKTKTDRIYERRWKNLQSLLKLDGLKSIKDLAQMLGFCEGAALTNFVRRHGEELVSEYGKLPHFETRQDLSEAWMKVMELPQ
jgi:hypothetical protein